jgi:hypothetical protein
MKWARDRWKLACLLVLSTPIMLLAIWAFWDAHKFEQWVASDATFLRPYEIVLVTAGEPLTPDNPLDVALLDKTLEGRWVTGLTRSEYRYSLLRRHAWVKVHLVTAKGSDPTARQEIKLLNKLEKSGNNWIVSRIDELTLP